MANIVIIYGGVSAEHHISIRTANTVINYLNAKHNITKIYVRMDGVWEINGKKEKSVTKSIEKAIKKVLSLPDIVVFPLIHGPYGEDGKLQGFLEVLKVPYIGSGVLSSAICMDKVIMRDIFSANNIPQTEYKFLTSKNCKVDIDFPCYVKPANLGSSIGISRCIDKKELDKALDIAFEYDNRVIIEKEVKGKEVQIGVMGNEYVICSVAGERIGQDGFLSHDDKISKVPISRAPAQIEKDVYEKAVKIVRKAYKALCCKDYARIDVFICDDGEVLVNEINTSPGITAEGLLPKMWKETCGHTLTEFLDEIIDLRG